MSNQFLSKINIACKKVFVFDWDGTVLDSMLVKQENFSTVLAQQLEFQLEKTGLKSQIKILYESFSGNPRKEIFYLILQNLNIDFSLISYDQFSLNLSIANKKALQKASIFPDAELILDKLVKNNKKIFISSSTPQEELNFLVDCHLTSKVLVNLSGILGSRDHFTKGIDHLKYICEESNCLFANILVIGDDLADFELSTKAGVDCILIDRNNRFVSMPVSYVHNLEFIAGLIE